ncbi:hypothetical protein NMG60_11012172 [Bertholletia excelsa]
MDRQSQSQPQTQSGNQAQTPNSNANTNTDQDFSLKETSPSINRAGSTLDLVEQMNYLYIRVVKAKALPPKDPNDSCNPYVEVKLGNYKASTKHFQSKPNPEWNQVFALLEDRIQSATLELFVKDKESSNDDYIGKIVFELSDVPKRVPPDSPLAPQWYRLENRSGQRGRAELMLSIWLGTQADECFFDTSHLDASGVSGDGLVNIRSKVYMSPKLWYLRVNAIEAQDLQFSDRSRHPQVFVRALLGNVVTKTKISQVGMWNEDLMLVAAEPFEEMLVLSVENKVAPDKDEILGKCRIQLQNVDKRLECTSVNSKWYNLEKHQVAPAQGQGGGGQKRQEPRVVGKIHTRISLDGGYHVLDELTQYSSDFRASAKQLWKPSIGILELGILSAQNLSAMKTTGTMDAYCVAKYGNKWVRTRTVLDSSNPKWNEQYTWEVFDPCTVLTIVVFDNCRLQGVDNKDENCLKDERIGKVRIRLSTLETGRVYTHSYPLIVLQPSGVKKMGEIQLAVRFTYSSLGNILSIYSQPLLPKMHYLLPLSTFQQDSLRHQTTQIISMRMSRAEPPLRRETVEYMLDVGSNMWSIRKSKAFIYRISRVLSGLALICGWFDEISRWKNPFKTVGVHVLCLVLVIETRLILPTFFFTLVMAGLLNYGKRQRHPPYMDVKLSQADTTSADELDEEFDTFPSSREGVVLKARYDRLRCISSRMQAVVGDLATQSERFSSLLCWRDPRATSLFMVFCSLSAILLIFIPTRVLFVLVAYYVLRHPRFRHEMPSPPLNFFRRLPTKADGFF